MVQVPLPRRIDRSFLRFHEKREPSTDSISTDTTWRAWKAKSHIYTFLAFEFCSLVGEGAEPILVDSSMLTGDQNDFHLRTAGDKTGIGGIGCQIRRDLQSYTYDIVA